MFQCPNCGRYLAYPLAACAHGRCPICGYAPGIATYHPNDDLCAEDAARLNTAEADRRAEEAARLHTAEADRRAEQVTAKTQRDAEHYDRIHPTMRICQQCWRASPKANERCRHCGGLMPNE